MLKTPKIVRNPLIDILAISQGGMSGHRNLGEGYFESGGFNQEHLIWPRGNAPSWYQEYPTFNPDSGIFSSYGVCDNPQQFIKKFGQMLAEDKRTFVVGFTHVTKDPSNAGEGGGWRWHKWGEYVGEGFPTREYLDDEAGFENGVYTFKIMQIDGPHLEWDHKANQYVEGDGK